MKRYYSSYAQRNNPETGMVVFGKDLQPGWLVAKNEHCLEKALLVMNYIGGPSTRRQHTRQRALFFWGPAWDSCGLCAGASKIEAGQEFIFLCDVRKLTDRAIEDGVFL